MCSKICRNSFFLPLEITYLCRTLAVELLQLWWWKDIGKVCKWGSCFYQTTLNMLHRTVVWIGSKPWSLLLIIDMEKSMCTPNKSMPKQILSAFSNYPSWSNKTTISTYMPYRVKSQYLFDIPCRIILWWIVIQLRLYGGKCKTLYFFIKKKDPHFHFDEQWKGFIIQLLYISFLYCSSFKPIHIFTYILFICK